MHFTKDAFKRYVMNHQKKLTLANHSMLTTGIAFAIATYLAYGLENTLPLAVIALCHVAQIVLAGLFKVSYVVRLVCQKQLGMEVE